MNISHSQRSRLIAAAAGVSLALYTGHGQASAEPESGSSTTVEVVTEAVDEGGGGDGLVEGDSGVGDAGDIADGGGADGSSTGTGEGVIPDTASTSAEGDASTTPQPSQPELSTGAAEGSDDSGSVPADTGQVPETTAPSVTAGPEPVITPSNDSTVPAPGDSAPAPAPAPTTTEATTPADDPTSDDTPQNGASETASPAGDPSATGSPTGVAGLIGTSPTLAAEPSASASSGTDAVGDAASSTLQAAAVTPTSPVTGLLALLGFPLLGGATPAAAETPATWTLLWWTRRLRSFLDNQAPTAGQLPTYTVSDGTATGTLGFTDTDGDALAYTLESGPSHGQVELFDDGTFRYTPDADYTGSDSFTVSASDDTSFHLHGFAGLLALFTGDHVHDTTTTISINVPGTTTPNTVPTVNDGVNPTVGEPVGTTGVIIGSVAGVFSDTDALRYSATGPWTETTTPGTYTAEDGSTLLLDPATGDFTFLPSRDARFDASAPGTGDDELIRSFTVVATDTAGQSASVNVSVPIDPITEVVYSTTDQAFQVAQSPDGVVYLLNMRPDGSYYIAVVDRNGPAIPESLTTRTSFAALSLAPNEIDVPGQYIGSGFTFSPDGTAYLVTGEPQETEYDYYLTAVSDSGTSWSTPLPDTQTAFGDLTFGPDGTLYYQTRLPQDPDHTITRTTVIDSETGTVMGQFDLDNLAGWWYRDDGTVMAMTRSPMPYYYRTIYQIDPSNPVVGAGYDLPRDPGTSQEVHQIIEIDGTTYIVSVNDNLGHPYYRYVTTITPAGNITSAALPNTFEQGSPIVITPNGVAHVVGDYVYDSGTGTYTFTTYTLDPATLAVTSQSTHAGSPTRPMEVGTDGTTYVPADDVSFQPGGYADWTYYVVVRPADDPTNAIEVEMPGSVTSMGTVDGYVLMRSVRQPETPDETITYYLTVFEDGSLTPTSVEVGPNLGYQIGTDDPRYAYFVSPTADGAVLSIVDPETVTPVSITATGTPLGFALDPDGNGAYQYVIADDGSLVVYALRPNAPGTSFTLPGQPGSRNAGGGATYFTTYAFDDDNNFLGSSIVWLGSDGSTRTHSLDATTLDGAGAVTTADGTLVILAQVIGDDSVDYVAYAVDPDDGDLHPIAIPGIPTGTINVEGNRAFITVSEEDEDSVVTTQIVELTVPQSV